MEYNYRIKTNSSYFKPRYVLQTLLFGIIWINYETSDSVQTLLDIAYGYDDCRGVKLNVHCI